MAPLTRNRAESDGKPKTMAETYCYQRASAGLIISEATQISPIGKGYLDTPGIYSNDELFGPVASLISAKNATDAMRIANDSHFGLGGGIITQQVDQAIEVV